MIKEKEKVQDLLDGYGLQVDWANVIERLSEQQLLEIIGDYEGIICGDDQFTPQVYDKAQNLKAIVKWGTGIDSLLAEEAQKRGIQVFRTIDAFTEPVSDSTLGFILNYCRNIQINDRLMKEGKWEKADGKALSEMTVGIIGLGNIGRAVAKRLKGFGCRIIANDIVDIDETITSSLGVSMVPLKELCKESDVITIHCDLNKTSFHLLDYKTFQGMEKRPYIVNTARGPIIKEDDFILALEEKLISGGALDVFEEEPLDKESPLRKKENVNLSAHCTNSSPKYWGYVHKSSIEQLIKGVGL